MKKWILIPAILIVGIPILAIVFLLVVPRSWLPERQPDFYVEHRIISPLPETLHRVKTLLLFEPTLGDGLCIAAYSVTPADFGLILKTRPWADDFSVNLDLESLHQQTWPNSAPKVEAYHFGKGGSKDIQMAVTPDHTKLIFAIPL